MASFAFGFQLDGGGGGGGNGEESSPSATRMAVAAPPSFTAAAAASQDTMTARPPPRCEIVPVVESAGTAAAIRTEQEDTREVPIGAGPPMRVTERAQGVMADVPEGVDLIPGIYEGGLKVWEASVDLVRFMRQAADNGAVTSPSSVLELGCGHGLPGIHALQQGARVCFMDLNSEVLAEITRRNIALNYGSSPEGHVLLVSGDWADASRALCLQWAEPAEREKGEGPWFDLILSAETFYTAEVADKLLAAIQRHLGEGGQALVAGKRFYFGTHGSVADLVARAGQLGLEAGVVASVEDGLSNIRDIVRLARRPR